MNDTETTAVEEAYKEIFVVMVTQFYYAMTGTAAVGDGTVCVKRFRDQLAKARLAHQVTLKVINEEPSDE